MSDKELLELAAKASGRTPCCCFGCRRNWKEYVMNNINSHSEQRSKILIKVKHQTLYVTEDGAEWDTLEEAIEDQKILCIVQKIKQRFPDFEDTYSFADWISKNFKEIQGIVEKEIRVVDEGVESTAKKDK